MNGVAQEDLIFGGACAQVVPMYHLSKEAKEILDWISDYAKQMEMDLPLVISTCRTSDQQQDLQDAWDRGEKRGLRVRPADNSAHIPDQRGFCRAFDLGNDDNWLQIIGPAVTRNFPWARWGGNFIPVDMNHFDVPKGTLFTIRLV